MEALQRILEQVRQNTTSKTSIKKKYNCEICNDTTWIEGEKGAKRCICSVKAATAKVWERYGVDPKKVKKINEYKVYDKTTEVARDRAIDYVYNFDSTKTLDTNWITFLGQPGAGKSHLSISLGATLLSKGVQVVYMPYVEVVQELKGNAVDVEKYRKLSNRYKTAEVLVIDDLFKDKVRNGEVVGKLTDVDMRHVYQLINYRYNNNLPTIISSECTPGMLLELDDALGSRILEKSAGKITVFEGSSYNYRVRTMV